MADLDFYFFPGSTHTYLTVNRIDRLATEAGVSVRWRPYNLRAILLETKVVPFSPGTAKRRYMWRDIERRATSLGIPYTREPRYPVDPSLISLRVAMVAAREGWCAEFTKAYYRAWFLEDRPAGLDDNMPALLSGLGRDPEEVLATANEESFNAVLDASADEARRIGLFGSPHFVVQGEVFWGDDRLEDALAWAARAVTD
ncbi:MAG: DsbA family protein [Hyphomicrobiales bacterium]|nr:DsbA family protein [Hyphomicrobiales bacterium]